MHEQLVSKDSPWGVRGGLRHGSPWGHMGSQSLTCRTSSEDSAAWLSLPAAFSDLRRTPPVRQVACSPRSLSKSCFLPSNFSLVQPPHGARTLLPSLGENLAVIQEEPRGDPWVWLGKPRAHHVPVPESARVGRSQVIVTPGLLASWPLAGRHLPSLGPVYCGLQNSQLFLLTSPTPGPHGIHLQACSGQPGCACWCCPLCWTTGQGEGTEVRNATLIPASCPLLSVLLCL